MVITGAIIWVFWSSEWGTPEWTVIGIFGALTGSFIQNVSADVRETGRVINFIEEQENRGKTVHEG